MRRSIRRVWRPEVGRGHGVASGHVGVLDPLRDEDRASYRTLLDAGVSAVNRTVNGTFHGGDGMFRAAMPEGYLSTIRNISSFAHSRWIPLICGCRLCPRERSRPQARADIEWRRPGA